MSGTCEDMLAISSVAAVPSILSGECGSKMDLTTISSDIGEPVEQSKTTSPHPECRQSPSKSQDLIIVNGIDLSSILSGKKDDGDKGPTSELPGANAKQSVPKLESVLGTCEFSSDEEVMDSSVLQVIDEVNCSSPESSSPVKAVGEESEKKVEEPPPPPITVDVGPVVNDVLMDSDIKSESQINGIKRSVDGNEKNEEPDDYISLLEQRLATTDCSSEGNTAEDTSESASKRFKFDDPDDGQHVTVEVDPPFVTSQDADDQQGDEKPTRRLTRGEFLKLAEKLVMEQITASERAQLEALKIKCEQLERNSEKWRKKAFTLQKQITEQQIVIQRQNLTKKPPYILKPQLRSVGLQVEMNRSQVRPQIPLLPKSAAASVTIRPIGPVVVPTSPNKSQASPTISSHANTNGISVSILQARARSIVPGLRPYNTPLPVPNVTVTPAFATPIQSSMQQGSNAKMADAKGLNKGAKNPSDPATSVPIPTRLIPNQSVARQTPTMIITKPPTMPGNSPTVVKIIDLASDEDANAATLNKDKVTTVPSFTTCVMTSVPGGSISVSAGATVDSRAVTIVTPSVTVGPGGRKMMSLTPLTRSMAMPMTPSIPFRLSATQVARPVSQQILHSTGIPNGARVTYLVPTSVALLRPPLNGTIVAQPIQKYVQPTTIIRPPIAGQTLLLERRAVPTTTPASVVPVAVVNSAPTDMSRMPAPAPQGTIVKAVVAGGPNPSIVTPLASLTKNNTPLMQRIQEQCQISKIQQHPAPLPSPVYSSDVHRPLPASPSLKVSKEENGIVLSWDMPKGTLYTDVRCYQLYAYQESNLPASTSLWKKVGDVKALPLPMACTLTQFLEGHKYHFSVRAVDNNGRIGRFSIPGSITLPAKRPLLPK